MATATRTAPRTTGSASSPSGNDPLAASSSRRRTLITWILSVLLAAMFLLSGWGKLSNAEASNGMQFDEQFVAWGYPAWFRLVVGAAEVLGAVALLIPALRFFGATGLTFVMAGAIVTHLANAEAVAAPIPLVLGLLTGTVAWLARPHWVQQRLASLASRSNRTA